MRQTQSALLRNWKQKNSLFYFFCMKKEKVESGHLWTRVIRIWSPAFYHLSHHNEPFFRHRVLKKFSDTSSEETEKKEKEVGRRFRDSEEESEALEAANSFSRIDQRMDKKLESKDEENSTHSGACTIKLFTSEGKQLSRNYKWGFKNTVSLRRYCNCCKAKFLIIWGKTWKKA